MISCGLRAPPGDPQQAPLIMVAVVVAVVVVVAVAVVVTVAVVVARVLCWREPIKLTHASGKCMSF
jgi:hypothetical protein